MRIAAGNIAAVAPARAARARRWALAWIGGSVLAVALVSAAGCGGSERGPVAERDEPAPAPLAPPEVAVDPESTAHFEVTAAAPEQSAETETDAQNENASVDVPAPGETDTVATAEGDDAPEARTVAPLGGPGTTPAATDIGQGDPIVVSEPTVDSRESVDSGESVGAGESGPESWEDWPEPQCVLVISGQQHGYIEPCGCTGLDRQKGGLMRRYTLVEQLRGRGWDVLPLDAGNQVRRSGRQAAIKFRMTVRGLTEMGYGAVGFGPDDLRLGASELLSVAASDGDQQGMFASANVELLAPDLVPTVQRIELGGRTIGITSALDPDALEVPVDDAIVIGDMKEKVAAAKEQLDQQQCDFTVLLVFGDDNAARELARQVPGFDLIVAAGTYGEPTYQAEPIEGTDSRLILTGDKGMHVGLVGLYEDQPFKYARVPLSHEFEDAPAMLQLMADYQEQLKALGLEGLGLRPISHPSGREFVGSETCGQCHSTAYEIWEGTPHARATEDIVNPGERGEIARHFDPECLSCHVTGWNPQGYYPYETGYLSLEDTPALTGSGCENCHGPGKAHVQAESGEVDLTEAQIVALRDTMRLPLERAREKCLECHDLDNSPDFHLEGAFEEYWSHIEHYGVD